MFQTAYYSNKGYVIGNGSGIAEHERDIANHERAIRNISPVTRQPYPPNPAALSGHRGFLTNTEWRRIYNENIRAGREPGRIYEAPKSAVVLHFRSRRKKTSNANNQRTGNANTSASNQRAGSANNQSAVAVAKYFKTRRKKTGNSNQRGNANANNR